MSSPAAAGSGANKTKVAAAAFLCLLLVLNVGLVQQAAAQAGGIPNFGQVQLTPVQGILPNVGPVQLPVAPLPAPLRQGIPNGVGQPPLQGIPGVGQVPRPAAPPLQGIPGVGQVQQAAAQAAQGIPACVQGCLNIANCGVNPLSPSDIWRNPCAVNAITSCNQLAQCTAQEMRRVRQLIRGNP